MPCLRLFWSAALCFAYILGAVFGHSAWATPPDSATTEEPTAVTATTIVSTQPAEAWYSTYREATEAAAAEGKMLVIYFAADDSRCVAFDQTLADPQIVEKLRGFVKTKLPVDATIRTDGKEATLLQHPAFFEMRGTPGVAIIDYAHKDLPYYGCVVSTFPFLPGLSYTSREMGVILELPPGTLTQRTIIYAVRIHPEQPASSNGQFDPNLRQEAESHATYQAKIGLQGHHAWNFRFQRINAILPRGLFASEVCAESWPGQGLLEAAIECVRCWRLSSGHWGAVREPHQVYGYDMQRGPNGVWYATGIFGRNEMR